MALKDLVLTKRQAARRIRDGRLLPAGRAGAWEKFTAEEWSVEHEYGNTEWFSLRNGNDASILIFVAGRYESPTLEKSTAKVLAALNSHDDLVAALNAAKTK